MSAPSREPRLVPFQADHSRTVAAWAPTPEEVLSWCGLPDAPVPASTVAGWSRAEDVRAFLLLQDDTPVAYGELWLDEDEEEVELARLLVDPARRGQGLGRALAALLVATARTEHPELAATVALRVLPDNVAGHRAYRAAGFTFVDPGSEAAWNAGQPRPYRWMVHPGG